MKMCFFGSETDNRTIINLILAHPKRASIVRECRQYGDYDSFVRALCTESHDVIFITENNANGMEGVIAVRNLHPQTPVVWFSNDEGFGSQAYRLNTDFFHCKPVDAKILDLALKRLNLPV